MPTVNQIAAEEITLTIAVSQFPREMVKELQRTGKFQVVKFDEGIYHISGGMFPIQIIHTEKLSKENNFWLRNLTRKLKKKEEAESLLNRYNERKQENLYQSVMDIIVKANIELFEEVDDMCDALMEIVKPKVEAKIQEALNEGLKEGLKEGRMIEKLEFIRKKLAKGMSAEEIADLLEEPIDVIKGLMVNL